MARPLSLALALLSLARADPVPAQAPVSTACPCSMSGDTRQAWLPLAAVSGAAAAIVHSDSGLCLRAGLDDAAGGGAGLGGVTCQGACVTLSAQCDTLWNVSLNVPDDGHVRVTVAAVGNANARELVGMELVSMNGRAEVWPRDAACCGANRVVQEPDTGLLSFLVTPAACLVNATDCCPSAAQGVECSGFGACDVRTAQCACAACKTGTDCTVDSQAACTANGGTCFAEDGRCLCADGCKTGPNCGSAKTCSNGGYCVSGACRCSDPCSVVTPANDGCMPKPCGPNSVCEKGSCFCTDDKCSVMDEDTQTCVPVVDCGPNGSCSGGTCTCSSACWTGPFCNISACANDAICADVAGKATCDCRNDCFTIDASGQCTVPKDCGAFGVCPRSGPLFGWDDAGQDLPDMPRVLSLGGTYADCWSLCNQSVAAGCVSWSYAQVSPPTCGGSGPLCWLKRIEPAFAIQGCRVAGEPGPAGGPGGQCECADACGIMDGNGKCSAKRDCGTFGFCDPVNGCSCLPCYTTDADGKCTVPRDCGAGFCEMDSCVCNTPCDLPDDDGRCVPRDCGHGTCNNLDGSCECDACFEKKAGGACQIPTDCGPHGTCSNASASATCVCDACWLPDADQQCSVQQACSGAGTCDAGSGACVCDDPFCAGGPTCSATQSCTSGAGTCSGGKCVCASLCRSGAYCEQLQSCNAHGSCVEATGACACAPGYSAFAKCATCDGCHSGTGCAVLDTCSGNGVCALDAQGFKTGCTCAPGFSGDACENAPASAAASAAGAAGSGAVAAGVVVPLLLAAAAAAVFARRGGFARFARGGALLPPQVPAAAAAVSAASSRAGSLAPAAAPSGAAAERASLLSSARAKGGAAPVLKYGVSA